MKIYRMTATFGKLEHETLTLQPGLNVIHAPNEWGKSTWCAFFLNMLYGIDTRAKTTKNALADKERFAPWSGAPMSGSIDLHWNGRDITIQRRTKGRLIFGEFSAFETETGIEIPELNATNCGTMLLGVERSVLERAGFLKLSDLPLTQDDALRRRLNNLVTTGDESGAGDRLGKQLKELKNKCRFNRTGLLPQAELQRDRLEGQLAELQSLQQQKEKLLVRQAELEGWVAQLENHRSALRYEASLEDAKRVEDALAQQALAQAELDRHSAICAPLPSAEAARIALQRGQALQQQRDALQMEAQMLPPAPSAPEKPAYYGNRTHQEGYEYAMRDYALLAELKAKKKKLGRVYGIYGILAGLVILAAVVLGLWKPEYQALSLIAGGALVALSGIVVLITGLLTARKLSKQIERLYRCHPGYPEQQWVATAQVYAAACKQYEKENARAIALRGDLDARQEKLRADIAEYTDGNSLEATLEAWKRTLEAWDALGNAQRSLTQATDHANALKAMAKIVDAPTLPDTLTYSPGETDNLLSSARFDLRQLHNQLGQIQGRGESLGQEALLRAQLKQIHRRIHQLEDTYAALELAQNALSAATTQLQRRFAPRISKRAQELFSRLTGGRYQRITLGEDLSLSACTQDEDTLRSALWRSDGTVDQLYLALRLAVAEELTPEAPLILDDALVRFDDARMAVALDILKELGEHKQVILFTCQQREGNYVGGNQ